MNETQLNQSVVRELKRLGRWAYKTSDRFNAGVPDVYCTGGIWFEGKVATCKTHVNIVSKISPEQYIFAKMLEHFGDRWYLAVAIKFDGVIKYGAFRYEQIPVPLKENLCKPKLSACLEDILRVE